MIFRYIFIAILMIGTSLPANAVVEHDVTDYVNNILTQFNAIANDTKLDSHTKVERVKPLLSENLDIKWMSQFSLGRHRKNLTPEELDHFTAIYRDYIITSYASAIKQYNGQQVKILKVQNISDNEYVVKTAIMKSGQDPFLVDYLVRSYPGKGYKVFDVVTEGVSMITSQQAEFGNTIITNGIKELEQTLLSKTQGFDQGQK